MKDHPLGVKLFGVFWVTFGAMRLLDDLRSGQTINSAAMQYTWAGIGLVLLLAPPWRLMRKWIVILAWMTIGLMIMMLFGVSMTSTGTGEETMSFVSTMPAIGFSLLKTRRAEFHGHARGYLLSSATVWYFSRTPIKKHFEAIWWS